MWPTSRKASRMTCSEFEPEHMVAAPSKTELQLPRFECTVALKPRDLKYDTCFAGAMTNGR